MAAPISPTSHLQLLVIFQCAILALFLLARRRPPLPNRFLGTLLLLLGCHLSVEFLQQARIVAEGLTLIHAAPLLYGPLFYAYIRSLLFEKLPSRPGELLHLLPVAVTVLLLLGRFLSDPLLALGTFASLGSYLAASLLAIRRARHVIESNRSGRAPAAMNWLFFAVIGLGVVFALDVVSFAASRHTASRDSLAAVLLFGTLLLYVTGFFLAALRMPETFSRVTAVEAEVEAETRVPLTDAEGRELQRIDELMAARRLYLDPDLDLAKVASASGLAPRLVSGLINRGHGRPFAAWVNRYRVEHARRLLEEQSDATVLEVLFAAGFNSKSTFNAVFKEMTGRTPTEFRRRS